MAQLFKPSANSIATASLFAAAAVPFIFVGGSAISRSPYNTKVGIPLEQPIPFSHQHHTKELGIDCRFCHWSVEESAHAGVPSSDVCMTCHSQVWTNSPLLEPLRKSYETNTPLQWVKVNAVPDFVYFNHALHVAKGISCNNCHGKVQEMHITWKGQGFRMAWCLECHSDPEQFLYTAPSGDPGNPDLTPREQVFELYRKISANERLTPVEIKLAQGLPQRVPNDDIHKRAKEGTILVKDRKIATSQLMDCYVCHH
ncbi:MAG: cytochrome c family protein [Fimbriimonadaceae bacterium]|nr:cytochrome c family protein [Fimbriimonadaceae bacterium]